jgi:hypothetical protein
MARTWEREMRRADILQAAATIATNPSAEFNDFAGVARLWAAYLDRPISDADVTLMMALLKIARIRNAPAHKDNYAHLAAYAACAGGRDHGVPVTPRHALVDESPFDPIAGGDLRDADLTDLAGILGDEGPRGAASLDCDLDWEE